MRTVWMLVVLATVCFLPTLAGDPPQPQADQVTSDSDLPAPLGCTDEGELTDGVCSKGQPVYLPDGEAIAYPQTTKVVNPSWPEETDKAIKASMNVQFVILPDGSVTEIQPMFLRVTLPGEEERRMNPTEDEYGFFKAASGAVARWRYPSPKLKGQPVAVYGSVCLDFVVPAAD